MLKLTHKAVHLLTFALKHVKNPCGPCYNEKHPDERQKQADSVGVMGNTVVACLLFLLIRITCYYDLT